MLQVIVYIAFAAGFAYVVFALIIRPARDLTKAGAQSLRHRRQQRERDNQLAQEMKKYGQG